MFDWKTLLSPDAGPAVQFIKYALCGGVATATHILIFHLVGWKLFPCLQPNDPFVRHLRLSVPAIDLHRRARNSMITNVIGFLFSNSVAYLLNILFVFKSGRHHWMVEFALFYAVSAVSLVIGTSLMGWLIRRFGMLTTVAFGSNIVMALLINFAMRKFVIFN
ncbi:MAG: GtrA family protein [bacterium]